ncbi:MAG TPA: MFS transporter [Polyangia bacterium]|nr:MFS transporter [Polyangia bacterium]HVY37632.1 MFS transporter [Polyangia bacterium]
MSDGRRRSLAALNAANFFVADMTAVVLPFLGTFLKERHWRYDQIGIAGAVSGLGVLLAQTPAGVIVDRLRARRMMLALTSLTVGLCYALLPVLASASTAAVYGALFTAGAASSFFVPLLAALALGLVGHRALSRTMGTNQSWNHAGNIAAALLAAAVVGVDVRLVFFAVAAVSVLAAASVAAIRAADVDEARGAGDGDRPTTISLETQTLRELFRNRAVLAVFAATALFHLANAPAMPLVALQVKSLHGTDRQVAMVVLVAQAVMIPVALLAGWGCARWGRKATFAIGFLALPVRIFLYSLARAPGTLLALQALDGIGAGIYGVAIVAVCADLTQGKGGFNALMGVIATAQAVGGVIGPLASGVMVQHLGFGAGYDLLAAIAAVAAGVFLLGVPETGPAVRASSGVPRRGSPALAAPPPSRERPGSDAPPAP